MREREKPSTLSSPGLRLHHHDTPKAPRAEFTQAEKRRIFVQMVVAELEAGLLRYSRRRALLRYAEDIGIPAFDANLLIAEAQYRAKQLEPIEFETAVTLPTAARVEAWPTRYKVIVALITAAIIDLLLIAWITH